MIDGLKQKRLLIDTRFYQIFTIISLKIFTFKILLLNVCGRLMVLIGHHGVDDDERKRIKYHNSSPIFNFFPLLRETIRVYRSILYLRLLHMYSVCACVVF